MKKINPIIIFSILIIYLEMILKLFVFKNFLNTGLMYTLIFSIPIVLLLTTLTKLFNEKINKVLLYILTFIICIYYEVQLVFFNLFSVPFSFSTIGLADQALDFTNIIVETLKTYWPLVISLLLPFILTLIFNKRIDTTRYNKYTISTLFILFITSYLLTFLTLIPNKSEHHSAYKLYYKIDAPKSIINKFGLLTYCKIDVKRVLLGYESELVINEETTLVPEEIKYEKNVLDLDLTTQTDNSTINQLNNYINSISGTYKNEYTGMFEGKNLIFILAEGFNEIAVDETRTPTLYKLVNNGFVFNNFYSPEFLSTTGGEFQATTGLIPTQEILSSWKSQAPYMGLSLGNVFNQLGYRTQAYHNWTYKYYKRQITMKTLGFENYIGCGNGLEKQMNCNWLTKDTDMINVTAPYFLNQEGNFMTYYITLSGHAEYSKYHNVAKIHWDTVKDLPYSDPVKYYLASQVELDKMLELLINKLTETNELNDTVIALVGDHYPYTLTANQINEVSTYKKDDTIEVNHSNLIIWNNKMKEPIVIDKVGSQTDVLPTLLNLFGIKYDSRLMIGKDILSNSEGLAIFSDYSWVSDYGTYYAPTQKFVLASGKTLDNQEEYINNINQKVTNAFSVSKMIVDTNYYTYILKKEM